MIGIVVLNYINWDNTLNCIESIKETTNRVNYHIYIVDNASPNGIPENIMDLLSKHQNITLIKNSINKGYSAGNNIGIKKALDDNCETILIANNDVLFLEKSILNMYEYLKENKDVGIVGPKILKKDGSIQIPGMLTRTGLKEKYFVNTVLRKLSKKTSDYFYCKPENYNSTFTVHSVHGCCFMMSKECAMEITPFDENTFLYEEELIIGIRMEKAKYKTVYYPESTVIHMHGQSTKNVKAFSFICYVESEIYYCRKYLNAGLLQFFPLYLIRTASFIYRTIKHEDYRGNILRYFTSTSRKLFGKI